MCDDALYVCMQFIRVNYMYVSHRTKLRVGTECVILHWIACMQEGKNITTELSNPWEDMCVNN